MTNISISQRILDMSKVCVKEIYNCICDINSSWDEAFNVLANYTNENLLSIIYYIIDDIEDDILQEELLSDLVDLIIQHNQTNQIISDEYKKQFFVQENFSQLKIEKSMDDFIDSIKDKSFSNDSDIFVERTYAFLINILALYFYCSLNSINIHKDHYYPYTIGFDCNEFVCHTESDCAYTLNHYIILDDYQDMPNLKINYCEIMDCDKYYSS